MIPRFFLFNILFCLFNVCAAFAAVSHASPDCLGPFPTYLLFALLTCTCVCSIVCLVVTFLQLIDWCCARYNYLHHSPEYRDENIARILRLI